MSTVPKQVAIRRVLVANRGEVAVRVMHTCRALGIETVAVHSHTDAHARHLALAEHTASIGGTTPAESYLSIPTLIDAARAHGADAVHPGYGFLSEDPDFANACRDAGLVFVGPSPGVIARTGSKIEVRQLAQSLGVPVVPGEEPSDQSLEGLHHAITAVGYPVMLKPSAGGGGKGMRVVKGPEDVNRQVGAARREAESAFTDGTLYVERRLDHPRHVEVQVAGDHHGNLVHFFERDCSVQRRYQKVIEETPSLILSPGVRDAVTSAALQVAGAAGYDNIGTVEFLVEGHGDDARFYFLEMNTRLQVEHPITELCTGVDLVRTQFEIAAGAPLRWEQSAIVSRGHAIECRVYAEDPGSDFLPQAGTIALYREPTGPGIRVDSGVNEGSVVPVQYDPLLAKVATHGDTREWARRRAIDALRRYVVLGVRTNVSFLRHVLELPRFVAGQIDTGLLQEARSDIRSRLADAQRTHLDTALAAVALAETTAAGQDRYSTSSAPDWPDPWNTL